MKFSKGAEAAEKLQDMSTQLGLGDRSQSRSSQLLPHRSYSPTPQHPSSHKLMKTRLSGVLRKT